MSVTGVGGQLPVDPLAELDTLVETHPEYLLFAGVLAVVAGIGAWFLYRWLTRPAGVRFTEALEDADTIAVVTHPNPDPDAMACAVGVARIAEWAGGTPTIRFPGQIRHQQNRAFRNVLDIDMERVESQGDLADADTVVLVDHNVARGFEGAQAIVPDAIVDHHIGGGEGRSFTDVRPEYGAAATIVTEYFQDLDAVPIDPDQPTPADSADLYLDATVATALLFGIHSDTNHLSSGCTAAEFAASSYLFPAIDEEKLDRIANPPVTQEVLDVKATAIENLTQQGSFGISDVGRVTDVDAIPQAADEVMRLEGLTAVIVVGERNGTLHISGRSRDDRVHMGRALESAVEGIPTASAGGHARMGGGQVPLDHLDGIGPKEETSRSELNQRIIECMNGNV